MILIDKKRLAVDIPEDIHNELKEMAKKYNRSITEIVISLITQLLIQNREHDKLGDNMENIRYCKECKKIWEGYPEILCCCNENIDNENHCHIEVEEPYKYGENGVRKETKCVPFIKDCEEHAQKCYPVSLDGDCHEECTCRNL